MSDKALDTLAKTIWEYHFLGKKLHHADVMIVMGSADKKVAEWAATLFLDGYAPRIIFSGERGARTAGWEKTEAEVFREIAVEKGVPAHATFIEPKSKNSGDNIRFSKELINAHGLASKKIIIVTKPYMERRASAIAGLVFPKSDVLISSAPTTYEEYAELVGKDRLINQMVGDLQRIAVYPKHGHQLAQHIPAAVSDAYAKLVKMGYTEGLIKESS